MIDTNSACTSALIDAAKQMCLAAQTAPKACGRDSVVTGIVADDEIKTLTAEMRRIQSETEGCRPIFARDADLIDQCAAVVLIGVKHQVRGLVPCGLCGHENCAVTVSGGGHCCFDDIDLGIAIGSAASVAADLRADNRVLYSAGVAAMNLKLLGENVGTIMAIPVSYAARNIFFVR